MAVMTTRPCYLECLTYSKFRPIFFFFSNATRTCQIRILSGRKPKRKKLVGRRRKMARNYSLSTIGLILASSCYGSISEQRRQRIERKSFDTMPVCLMQLYPPSAQLFWLLNCIDFVPSFVELSHTTTFVHSSSQHASYFWREDMMCISAFMFSATICSFNIPYTVRLVD